MQPVEIHRSIAVGGAPPPCDSKSLSCGFGAAPKGSVVVRILFGPLTNVDARASHRPGVSRTYADIRPGQAPGSTEEHLHLPASSVERRLR